MSLTLTVEYSQMNTHANICKRMAFYRWWMGLERAIKPGIVVKASAMNFGWSLHEGLDAAYEYWLLDEKQRESLFKNCFGIPYSWDKFIAVPTTVATMVFKHAWNGAKERGFTEDTGAEILRAYADRYWPESRNGIDVMATEVSGLIPLKLRNVGTHLLAGRIDRIFLEKGLIKPAETKTSSSLDEDFWIRHEQSYQTDGYLLLAESLYGEIYSVIIDGIATSGTARKEMPFKRREFRNTPLRRNRFLLWADDTINDILIRLDLITQFYLERDEKAIIQTIYKHYLSGGKPYKYFPENPESCTKYKKVCGYLPLCQYDVPIAMVKSDYTFTH